MPNTIQCTFITPEYFEQVLEFSRDHFVQDEPLCHYLGLHGSVFDDYFRHAIEQGTSVMAIDTAHGNKVVGVRAHRLELRPPTAPTEEQPPSKSDTEKEKENSDPTNDGSSLFELVDCAFNRYSPWEKTTVDKYLHFKYLCVDRSYRGRGIGVQMQDFTFAFMRRERVPLAYVLATSAYSQAVFQKVGFVTVDGMSYADYRGKDGQPVFSPDPVHRGWATMIKWVD